MEETDHRPAVNTRAAETERAINQTVDQTLLYRDCGLEPRKGYFSAFDRSSLWIKLSSMLRYSNVRTRTRDSQPHSRQ